jgi:hypothetical protein
MSNTEEIGVRIKEGQPSKADDPPKEKSQERHLSKVRKLLKEKCLPNVCLAKRFTLDTSKTHMHQKRVLKIRRATDTSRGK